MKTFLQILKWAGLVIGAAALILAIYVSMNWNRDYADVPMPDLHASTDPAVIARGEYLVMGPAHCIECHVGSQDEYDRAFETGEKVPLTGGFPFKIGPIGTLYSRNITPDPETGIGRYTDPQVARMIRHGVRGDNKVSIPELMPFGDLADDDVVGVLSYLRAQPPVKNAIPENEWTLFGKVMKTFVSATKPRLDVHPPKLAPRQDVSVERGAYVVQSIASCSGCHTPFNEMTGAPTGPRYSGGNPMEPIPRKGVDTSLWYKPPNITPKQGSALTRFPDRATFVARFRVGGRKEMGSPMPWEAMSKATPEDLGSIYEYLHTEPPAGEVAPTDPRVKQ